MAAALTLLVLLAGSLVIVRIASVALRLTGLPDHVARFQSISALTGAGFTTTESEAIVNFPIRRRVIVSLMIFGNLGLVSVMSTFIVAFGDDTNSVDAIIHQGLMIIGVIAFIAFVMTNKAFDKILCGLVSRILKRIIKAEQQHYTTVLAVDDTHCIAEHIYRGTKALPLDQIIPDNIQLNIMSVVGKEKTYYDEFHADFLVTQNETLTCFGKHEYHHALAIYLAEAFPFQPE